MRCINKKTDSFVRHKLFRTGLWFVANSNIRKILTGGCGCLCALVLAGCGSDGYGMPYDAYSVNSSFTVLSADQAGRAGTFAADLCIANENSNESAADMSQAEAAGLFSLGDKETLYAKNVHERLYPASLTKVMTALVALKNGNREDVLTASANVRITESGATLSGLKEGDKMTLDQALRILLIQSANDVAVMIAEQYGGTTEHFCEMMNEEAKAIGATNSNFTNPHGLTDENHYVTAYDMYLIFNEACKYELFKEIIGMSAYTTIYYDAGGGEVSFDKPSTNWYFNGEATAPAGITVLGGKTGTTSAARNCLVLLTSDTSGKSYISVIMKSEERGIMYTEMTNLLGVIQK